MLTSVKQFLFKRWLVIKSTPLVFNNYSRPFRIAWIITTLMLVGEVLTSPYLLVTSLVLLSYAVITYVLIHLMAWTYALHIDSVVSDDALDMPIDDMEHISSANSILREAKNGDTYRELFGIRTPVTRFKMAMAGGLSALLIYMLLWYSINIGSWVWVPSIVGAIIFIICDIGEGPSADNNKTLLDGAMNYSLLFPKVEDYTDNRYRSRENSTLKTAENFAMIYGMYYHSRPIHGMSFMKFCESEYLFKGFTTGTGSKKMKSIFDSLFDPSGLDLLRKVSAMSFGGRVTVSTYQLAANQFFLFECLSNNHIERMYEGVERRFKSLFPTDTVTIEEFVDILRPYFLSFGLDINVKYSVVYFTKILPRALTEGNAKEVGRTGLKVKDEFKQSLKAPVLKEYEKGENLLKLTRGLR